MTGPASCIGATCEMTHHAELARAIAEKVRAHVERCVPLALRGDGNAAAALGREAAFVARRELILWALDQCGWNLSRTARFLGGAGGTPNMLRDIRDLHLTQELEDARARGLVRRGAPRKNRRPGSVTP